MIYVGEDRKWTIMATETPHYNCSFCNQPVKFLEANCQYCGRFQDWSYRAQCPECDGYVDHKYSQRCPICNTLLTEWNIIIQEVLRYDYHTDVVVSNDVTHPESAGFERGAGKPQGQQANYRLPLQDGSEIHVKEYSDRYEVHRDRCTANNSVGHLVQDAPLAALGGLALLYFLFSG